MDGSRPLSTLVRSFLGSPFYSPHQQAHSCCGWLGYLNPWASRQAFRGPKQPRTSQFAADFGRDRFAFFFSLRAPVSLRICRRLSTLFWPLSTPRSSLLPRRQRFSDPVAISYHVPGARDARLDALQRIERSLLSVADGNETSSRRVDFKNVYTYPVSLEWFFLVTRGRWYVGQDLHFACKVNRNGGEDEWYRHRCWCEYASVGGTNERVRFRTVCVLEGACLVIMEVHAHHYSAIASRMNQMKCYTGDKIVRVTRTTTTTDRSLVS